MKKIIFTSLFVLTSYCAMAQFSINYSVGYGSYKMGDMKNFVEDMQSYVEGQYPGLKTVIVDNFPAYVTHSLDIGYKYKVHEFGIKGGFYSTGSKISFQDYSGEYEANVLINGYKTGLYYRNYFFNNKIGKKSLLSLFGEISPSAIISRTKITSHLTVFDQLLESEKTAIHKVDFAVLPQVGVRYNIIPQVGVQLTAGYEVSFGERAYKLDGNPRIDWSGFRASGGITVSL